MEETESRPTAQPRSGGVAAVLSALFPGLGQLYLGERKTALIFAAPVIALIAFIAFILMNRSVAVRILDPTISFGMMILVLVFGFWWVGAILNGWRGGEHRPGL